MSALVGSDLLGTAKTSNPDGDEGFSDCFGGDVRQRECLRPTGVSVDGGETVPEARRHRQRPYQVNIHMRETGRREFETPERDLHVPRHLGTLEGCTRECPCAAIFPHSQPHQLDSGDGSGVAEAVEGVKNLASEGCVYKWPWLLSGCIIVQVDVCPTEAPSHFSGCLAAPHPEPGNSQEPVKKQVK